MWQHTSAHYRVSCPAPGTPTPTPPACCCGHRHGADQKFIPPSSTFAASYKARSTGTLDDLLSVLADTPLAAIPVNFISRHYKTANDARCRQTSKKVVVTPQRESVVKHRREDCSRTIFGKLYDQQGRPKERQYGRRPKPKNDIDAYYGPSQQELWSNIMF